SVDHCLIAGRADNIVTRVSEGAPEVTLNLSMLRRFVFSMLEMVLESLVKDYG
uniref:Uncharacterized protein n=1 Tax=Anopheles atroparvus TaxID=41427 RepID=A0AAG5CNR4_ANOAO